MSKKIVFCGGGNMAEGIMRGLLQNGVNHPEDITVNELVPNRCEYLTKTYGVTATRDAEALIKRSPYGNHCGQPAPSADSREDAKTVNQQKNDHHVHCSRCNDLICGKYRRQ